MKTICVVGRKGGCGKTTLASHLALSLHLRGLATVLADADPQHSAVEVFKARRDSGPVVIPTSAAKLFALQLSLARANTDVMVLDTPAVLEEEIIKAVSLSDLAILLVRPTFLDLAALAKTSEIVRRLRRPMVAVVSQAPPARQGQEAPVVMRTLQALNLLNLPVTRTIVRTRAVYQTVMETGRSAEEQAPDSPAAGEIRRLCDELHDLAFDFARASGEALAPPALRVVSSRGKSLALQA
jgi:chromosome partitioning protein